MGLGPAAAAAAAAKRASMSPLATAAANRAAATAVALQTTIDADETERIVDRKYYDEDKEGWEGMGNDFSGGFYPREDALEGEDDEVQKTLGLLAEQMLQGRGLQVGVYLFNWDLHSALSASCLQGFQQQQGREGELGLCRQSFRWCAEHRFCKAYFKGRSVSNSLR